MTRTDETVVTFGQPASGRALVFWSFVLAGVALVLAIPAPRPPAIWGAAVVLAVLGIATAFAIRSREVVLDRGSRQVIQRERALLGGSNRSHPFDQVNGIELERIESPRYQVNLPVLVLSDGERIRVPVPAGDPADPDGPLACMATILGLPSWPGKPA